MIPFDARPEGATGLRGQAERLLRAVAVPSGHARAALDREELAGYGYANYGWLCALAAIALYLLASVPFRRWLFDFAILLVFMVLALIAEWLRRRYPSVARLTMGGMLLLQIALLTAVLIVPDPLLAEPPPAQLSFRFVNFLYLYAFVIGSVLSYSPGMVLWAGGVAATCWTIGFTTVYELPTTRTIPNVSLLDVPNLTRADRLAIYLDPHYMSLPAFRTQIVLLLLTSAVLALAVWRSRGLVLRQAVAENARANLARYFSPDLVEQIAAGGQDIEASRAAQIGVLFVDIVGFTALTENLPPERTIELLRNFHTRMSDTVFRCGGTVDKYIGDGVMATFGTPRRRPDDARRLFACACDMIGEVERWNRKRAGRDALSVRVGIGIHYGPVVIGNVGGERCLEFTVIGDTVNVASRLERLTRESELAVAASGEAIAALQAEGGRIADLPLTFREVGLVTLRGRAAPVQAWGAAWPDPETR
ncbi:MAG TPA: adenylate/guanylate cyclase domain-containing protein [Stellaceae bacterium]|nr:adenylate/guanylate cyclase domain-containing protein [Stellaceae bacterium]